MKEVCGLYIKKEISQWDFMRLKKDDDEFFIFVI